MLPIMYWDKESEELTKIRRANQLRARVGVPVKDDSHRTDDRRLDDVISALKENSDLAKQQQEKIEKLSSIVLSQQETLREIAAKDTATREIVTRYVDSPAPKIEIPEDLPVMGQVDIPVLDTTGIEVSTGSAGGRIVEGDSIQDRVEMLKKLKKKEG